jgi:hypothetical protein
MSKNINIEIPDNYSIHQPIVQKMMFIMNALEKGWSVRKSKDSYIFTKKHENKKEIFQENYLETFIASNFSNDFVSIESN